MNNILMISYLNTLSIPSFYDHADVGTSLPFLVIHVNQPMGFRADDGNYLKRWDFRIDLYTEKKSLELEAEIETLLDSLKIPWDQSEQFIESQTCWESEYSFGILGDPPPPAPEPTPDPTPDPEPEGDGDG